MAKQVCRQSDAQWPRIEPLRSDGRNGTSGE
jgi:hypothetical protein